MDDVIKLLSSWGPMLLLLGVWIYFIRKSPQNKYVAYLQKNNELLQQIAIPLEKIAKNEPILNFSK